MSRRRTVRAAGAMTFALLAACSSGTAKKHAGARPDTSTTTSPFVTDTGRDSTASRWVVCGRDISQTSAGIFVEDASDHDIVVTLRSPGDNVYLQFSHDCNADVHYQIVPPTAATVLASSPQGKPVAVVLHPLTQKFVVTFQRPSGPAKVTVE